MTTPRVEVLEARHVTHADADAICELRLLVWPSKTGQTRAELAAAMLAQRDAGAYAASHQRWHIIRDPSTPATLLAKAESSTRTVGTSHGPLAILALAGVCTRPEARGHGLGSLVVQSALQRVTADHMPFAYFQTTPERIAFYQRLGACLATNPVINSLAENPQANPFWDPITMRYPADATTIPWPDGVIDLRGPGY